MIKRAFFFFALVIIIVAGCKTNAADSSINGECPTALSARPTQTAFKGMELYSFQNDHGEWTFTIMLGTNRNKWLDEIKAAGIPLEEAKKRISELAVNESLTWLTKAQDGAGAMVDLPFPPEEIVKSLEMAAASCDVRLAISER